MMQQAGHLLPGSLPGWRAVALGVTVFVVTLPLWLR
jgi:hypothetical protein